MKHFLFYALPAVATLVACGKNNPPQQEAIRLVTLSVGSPQKAVSSSATALGAAALGTPAEFTVSGSPVKANGNASISVANAQLPAVNAATGSVVGVVKLTLNNLAATDAVSVQLKETVKGAASVQVVSTLPTTNALKDGKLKTPLTTTATPITRSTGNNNELYLLFQSGENGFSDADTAVVEITAKDTKFSVTVTGKGSKTKAENQTAVNKVTMVIGEKKIAEIKDATKVKEVKTLTSGSEEFTILDRENGTKTGLTSVEDLNIVVTNANKGDFKADASGKIGIVQLIFTKAKKLASGGSSDLVTFTAKLKSVFANGSKCKVALVNAAPTADKELFTANALKDNLMANGTNDKWSDYSSTGSGGEGTSTSTNTSKNTWLLFQGDTAGFGDNDVVIVEITATVGKDDNKATKTFTVSISVAKATGTAG